MSIDARLAVVNAAKGWVGTPYRHQASARGAGADCLGLIRGVWREVLGPEPELPPPYSPDWGETGGEEVLLAAGLRHLTAKSGPPEPGDVLLFRMRARGIAKHLGILTDPAPRFVHAYTGHGVVESPLSDPWRRRIAAVFEFPFERF
ncbi:MAG: NlpC/P60 family protein [Paracoccaceae bacterium]|nr:NlpC/P60 family protein [Paracoccaceae bacterium]